MLLICKTWADSYDLEEALDENMPARSHAALWCHMFWFTWQLSDGYGTRQDSPQWEMLRCCIGMCCVSRGSKRNVRATHIQKKARAFSLVLTLKWHEYIYVISLLKYRQSIIGRAHRLDAERIRGVAPTKDVRGTRETFHASEGVVRTKELCHGS